MTLFYNIPDTLSNSTLTQVYWVYLCVNIEYQVHLEGFRLTKQPGYYNEIINTSIDIIHAKKTLCGQADSLNL